MPTLYSRGLILLASALVIGGCAHQPTPEQANFAHCRAVANASKAENYPLVLQEADLCLEKNTLPPRLKSMVYLLKADAYSNLKRYQEAIAPKETSIALSPERESRAILDLSHLYRMAGNPQKALELVQSNLDAGMGETGKGAGFNMPTYYHLGLALSDLGQYREAAEAFSAGLQRQKDFAWAYYYRGVAYDHLGLCDDARADFQQFAKLANKKYVEAEHQANLDKYNIKL